MKSYEVIAAISAERNEEVFQFLYESDRAAYKAAVQVLASRRKLRPVFLERKPKNERHQWMQEALSKKTNEDAAQEILQAWLLGAHKEMITTFLDRCGVAHEGGLLEDLPAQPEKTVLQGAIEELLNRWPAELVAIYLQLFREMDITQWPDLEALIDGEPRLQLPSKEVAAA